MTDSASSAALPKQAGDSRPSDVTSLKYGLHPNGSKDTTHKSAQYPL